MSSLPSALRFRPKQTAGVETEYREEREHTPAVELLAGMTLSEFRASGLVVVVKCAVLGETVVFAADGTATSHLAFDDMGRVIYKGEELHLLILLGAHPEDLIAYHRLRCQVGGVEVESIKEKGTL